MAWQGSLLSCFLSCAPEFSWEFRHARPRGKYLDYLLTWFQRWRWRRFSNFGLRFEMADEDRQSDKMALTALLVVLLVRKIWRMRSRRRKTWAREWILRSQQQGAYPNLLRELNAEDHDAFRQFHPLDRDSFKTVLVMVAPFVAKQDTNMISPAWFHSAK